MPRLKGKGTRQTPKKCVKATAYPCGFTCISRKDTCRKILRNQAATFLEWLAIQEDRLSAINAKRAAKGKATFSLSDDKLRLIRNTTAQHKTAIFTPVETKTAIAPLAELAKLRIDDTPKQSAISTDWVSLAKAEKQREEAEMLRLRGAPDGLNPVKQPIKGRSIIEIQKQLDRQKTGLFLKKHWNSYHLTDKDDVLIAGFNRIDTAVKYLNDPTALHNRQKFLANTKGHEVSPFVRSYEYPRSSGVLAIQTKYTAPFPVYRGQSPFGMNQARVKMLAGEERIPRKEARAILSAIYNGKILKESYNSIAEKNEIPESLIKLIKIALEQHPDLAREYPESVNAIKNTKAESVDRLAEVVDRLNKSQSILPISVRYAIDTPLDDAFEADSLSSLEIIKDTNTIADGERVITYTGYGSGDRQFGIGGSTKEYGFAIWDKSKGRARLSDGYQQGKLSTKYSDYYRVTDKSESIIKTDRFLRKLDKEIEAITENTPDLGDKVKAILDQVKTLPNGATIADNIVSMLQKELGINPSSSKSDDNAIAPAPPKREDAKPAIADNTDISLQDQINYDNLRLVMPGKPKQALLKLSDSDRKKVFQLSKEYADLKAQQSSENRNSGWRRTSQAQEKRNRQYEKRREEIKELVQSIFSETKPAIAPATPKDSSSVSAKSARSRIGKAKTEAEVKALISQAKREAEQEVTNYKKAIAAPSPNRPQDKLNAPKKLTLKEFEQLQVNDPVLFSVKRNGVTDYVKGRITKKHESSIYVEYPREGGGVTQRSEPRTNLFRVTNPLEILPEKSIKMMRDAIASVDINKLEEMLHTGNRSWRKMFEQSEGITLPKTIQGTHNAIADWARQRGVQKPIEQSVVTEVAGSKNNQAIVEDYLEASFESGEFNTANAINTVFDQLKRNLSQDKNFREFSDYMSIASPLKEKPDDLSDVYFSLDDGQLQKVGSISKSTKNKFGATVFDGKTSDGYDLKNRGLLRIDKKYEDGIKKYNAIITMRSEGRYDPESARDKLDEEMSRKAYSGRLTADDRKRYVAEMSGYFNDLSNKYGNLLDLSRLNKETQSLRLKSQKQTSSQKEKNVNLAIDKKITPPSFNNWKITSTYMDNRVARIAPATPGTRFTDDDIKSLDEYMNKHGFSVKKSDNGTFIEIPSSSKYHGMPLSSNGSSQVGQLLGEIEAIAGYKAVRNQKEAAKQQKRKEEEQQREQDRKVALNEKRQQIAQSPTLKSIDKMLKDSDYRNEAKRIYAVSSVMNYWEKPSAKLAEMDSGVIIAMAKMAGVKPSRVASSKDEFLANKPPSNKNAFYYEGDDGSVLMLNTRHNGAADKQIRQFLDKVFTANGEGESRYQVTGTDLKMLDTINRVIDSRGYGSEKLKRLPDLSRQERAEIAKEAMDTINSRLEDGYSADTVIDAVSSAWESRNKAITKQKQSDGGEAVVKSPQSYKEFQDQFIRK